MTDGMAWGYLKMSFGNENLWLACLAIKPCHGEDMVFR